MDSNDILSHLEFPAADKLWWQKFFQDRQAWATGLWLCSPNTNIKNIKQCVEQALGYSCLLYGWIDIFNNDTWKTQLINVVTAIYLQTWLKSDPNTKQNIHSFCRQKYQADDGRNYESLVEDPNRYLDLWRNIQKVKAMKQVGVEQAKAENRYYKRDRLDIAAEADNSFEKECYEKPEWFGDLWIADKMSGYSDYKFGNLNLLKYVNEQPSLLMSGTSGTLRKSNKLLYECYDSYYRLYLPLFPTDRSSKDCGCHISDREYVVSAIMLHELEYTYHFHFAALLAIMIKENHYESDFKFDDYQYELSLFCKRFAKADRDLKVLSNSNNSDIFEYVSYDVLHSDNEIGYLLLLAKSKQASGIKPNYPLDPHEKNIKLERLMLLFTFNIIPSKYIRSWTEKDYRDARLFFEKDYPLYKIYSQIVASAQNINFEEIFNRKHDTCLDIIREFLSWLIKDSRKFAFSKDVLGREDTYSAIKAVKKDLRSKRRPSSDTSEG